jgi:hypothetical protein
MKPWPKPRNWLPKPRNHANRLIKHNSSGLPLAGPICFNAAVFAGDIQMTTEPNSRLYIAFSVLAGQSDALRETVTRIAPFMQPIGYADYLEGTKGFMDANLKVSRFKHAVEPLAFTCLPKSGAAFGDILDLAGALAPQCPQVVEYVTATEHGERTFKRGTGPAYKLVSLR